MSTSRNDRSTNYYIHTRLTIPVGYVELSNNGSILHSFGNKKDAISLLAWAKSFSHHSEMSGIKNTKILNEGKDSLKTYFFEFTLMQYLFLTSKSLENAALANWRPFQGSSFRLFEQPAEVSHSESTQCQREETQRILDSFEMKATF